MPNSLAHRVGAAVVVGAVSIAHETQNEGVTGKSFANTLLAAASGTLPDLIEPALHPNHRQFFHSFAMLGLVGYGLLKLYQWQPETRENELLRSIALIVGGAYTVHLLMDARTAKSLPLF
ncbi:MAG: metal-dependent hydrolase [Candidatus Thiodiazotropha sp.]